MPERPKLPLDIYTGAILTEAVIMSISDALLWEKDAGLSTQRRSQRWAKHRGLLYIYGRAHEWPTGTIAQLAGVTGMGVRKFCYRLYPPELFNYPVVHHNSGTFSCRLCGGEKSEDERYTRRHIAATHIFTSDEVALFGVYRKWEVRK